ncbi:MAG: FtsX-like permease family protein [Paracoccaceae bacterium]
MTLSARIAARELRGGIRGFRVFLLCLMLGVAAIASVGLVRGAIREALSDQGAMLLGGDAQYDFTYRRATPEERAWIDDHAAAVSEVIEFRSMLTRGTGDALETALTQVKAVDGAHPLIGALALDPPVPMGALGSEGGLPGIFLDQILADRLGLAPGDTVQLAGQPFAYRAAITREPDSTGAGIGLGPRSIVALSAIEATPILAPGSLYETEYRVILPEGTDLDAAKTAAEARFEGAGMRWSDSRRAAPGADRFVDRLGSFLVLVGLAGLAVGGVGISATVSAWIERKAETVATLRALGAAGGTIRAIFLWQLAALSALGILAGLGLAALVVVLSAGVIEAALPIPVTIALSAGPMFEAAVYGALVAAIFALWPLARMAVTRSGALYRAGRGRRWPSWPALALMAVLVAALLAAAVGFSGLVGLTLGTFGGVVGALVSLWLAAFGLRLLARRAAHLSRGRPALRAALAAIGAPRSEAAPVILSLGLGLSVLAAVGQVDAALRSAIQRDLPDVAPAYFMIDIQNSQLPEFLTTLDALGTVDKVETAPMLRGVITEINGQPARDVAGEHWVLRGDRGVTYATTPREALTAGTFWPEDYAGPPQASFAAKEAQELGLKLGDKITVNILGRDIEAEITSLRDVDFSTAGIGFVLTLNPAALQGAPHVHIATIYAAPEDEAAILRKVAQEYPNVTAIRVRDAIARVSEALGTIARATSLAAGVTLLTGFVVLIGAAAAGEGARNWEAAMLKTLGATRATILRSFALRAALMGAAAGLVAIGFGALAGYAVLEWVMEAQYRFAPLPALAIVLGGVLVTLTAGLVFALRPLAARPARILRARE